MLGRDGIAALVILALCATLFVATLGLAASAFVPIGPGVYPRLVLGVTGVLALALLVTDIAMHRRRGAAPTSRQPRSYGRVVLLFLAFGVYVAALPLLGFRVATVLFVAGAQAVLDPPHGLRRWSMLFAVALGTMLVSYLVFERYLAVLLPRGRWTGF